MISICCGTADSKALLVARAYTIPFETIHSHCKPINRQIIISSSTSMLTAGSGRCKARPSVSLSTFGLANLLYDMVAKHIIHEHALFALSDPPLVPTFCMT